MIATTGPAVGGRGLRAGGGIAAQRGGLLGPLASTGAAGETVRMNPSLQRLHRARRRDDASLPLRATHVPPSPTAAALAVLTTRHAPSIHATRSPPGQEDPFIPRTGGVPILG